MPLFGLKTVVSYLPARNNPRHHRLIREEAAAGRRPRAIASRGRIVERNVHDSATKI